MKTVPRKKSHQSEISPLGKVQKIQERAYELYLQRGQEPGHELTDWLQAEQEVCGAAEHRETA